MVLGKTSTPLLNLSFSKTLKRLWWIVYHHLGTRKVIRLPRSPGPTGVLRYSVTRDVQLPSVRTGRGRPRETDFGGDES